MTRDFPTTQLGFSGPHQMVLSLRGGDESSAGRVLVSRAESRCYGLSASESTASQLRRFFLLDRTVLGLIATRRQDHNRLGMAVLVGTVRFMEHP